jgi:hypothetical protein
MLHLVFAKSKHDGRVTRHNSPLMSGVSRLEGFYGLAQIQYFGAG